MSAKHAPVLSNVQRTLKNTIALSFTGAGQMMLGFLLQIYIARKLGAVGLGKYAIMMAYLAIFQVLASAGLNRLIIREVSRQRDEAAHYWLTTLAIQLVAALGSWAGLIAFSRLIGQSPDVLRMLTIAGGSLLPYAIINSAQITLQGVEQMEWQAIGQTVVYVIYLATAVFLLQAGHGATSLAAVIIAGQSGGALFLFIVVWRLGWLTEARLRLRLALSLLRQAPYFFLMNLSVIGFNRMDILFISYFIGEAAAGVYNAAKLILQVCNLLAASYVDALYPSFARLFHRQRERLLPIAQASFRYASFIFVPLALIIAFSARPVIGLLYHRPDYAHSAFLLRLLIWQTLFFLSNAILSRLLLAMNRQDLSFWVAFLRLLAALVYYSVAVRLWGTTGIAVAFLLASLTSLSMNSYHVFRLLGPALHVQRWRPLLTAILLMTWPYWLRLQPFWLSAMLAFTTYVAVLLLGKAILPADWALLNELIRRPGHLPVAD